MTQMQQTATATTLLEIVRKHAQEQPDKIAYRFLKDGESNEQTLTFAELDEKARAIGAELQKKGLFEKTALLLYPPGLDYITAFFGCMYAGTIAVPVYPPRQSRNMLRLQAILEDAQATIALTDTATRAKILELAGQTAMELLDTEIITTEAAGDWQAPELTGSSLMFLQYTSGSTGTPKGVMVSHSNLLHNENLIRTAVELNQDSVIVSWLPLYHDMGLIGNLLLGSYLGATCNLMSPLDFLQQPFLWLSAISRYRATLSGGPNFAYDLCIRKITPEQKATLDLSCWISSFNGAEPVRASTLEKFTAAFAECGFRSKTHYPCYGLAEATLFVTGGSVAFEPKTLTISSEALEANRVVEVTTDQETVNSRTFVGCGHQWLDQKVAIVNPETLALCAPDEVGEIWVSSPSVGQGYWGRKEATEQTFFAYTKDQDGPYLRTGDLGFLKDGELYVSGRSKDLIVIRGRNHYPQDIEYTVDLSHQAIRKGCCAAFSVDVKGEERLVVVAELERSFRPRVHEQQSGQAAEQMKEIVQAVKQAINAEHQLKVYDVVFVKTGSIPKTSSGKIQRHACKNGYLDQTLDVWG